MTTFGALEWDPEAMQTLTIKEMKSGERNVLDDAEAEPEQEVKDGQPRCLTDDGSNGGASIVTTTLQYRKFLSEQVNFKKVVDLSSTKPDEA